MSNVVPIKKPEAPALTILRRALEQGYPFSLVVELKDPAGIVRASANLPRRDGDEEYSSLPEARFLEKHARAIRAAEANTDPYRRRR